MHPEAFNFMRQFTTLDPLSVIEVGSRDINGTARPLFPNAQWIGLDLYPGPAVDVVCDMMDYTPDALVDLVVCCEVLEHAEGWAAMVHRMATWIKPGGRLLITCAGTGRKPHSHHDGGELRPGEYYGNISSTDLMIEVWAAGLVGIIDRELRKDTQVAARKPE